MNLSIINNGCIREHAMENNLEEKMKLYNINRTSYLEESDCLLYVTCSGCGDTIKDTLRDIDTLNRYSKKSNLKIIIVGCLLNKHEYLFKMFKDNSNIKFITNEEWVIPVINYLCDINKRTTYIEKLKNRTYSFDKNNIFIKFMLEDGCLNKCSFCKVHYNEKERHVESVPYELALTYLTNLVKKGTKSINLGGENLTLYGLDLYGRKRLHELVSELSKIDSLEMIRLDELVVNDMYDDLFNEIISNPKVISTSLQLESASDRLLKLMGRTYTLEQYDEYAKKIIDSGKYISTVLMSGFPTESYEDIDITIDYLRKRELLLSGICEYSNFKYIPSSKFIQFSREEKNKHTMYLKRNTNNFKYDICLKNIKRQNKLIYIDKIEDYYIFKSYLPMINIISRNSLYEELVPGDIVIDSPKRLVKKSTLTNNITYKI